MVKEVIAKGAEAVLYRSGGRLLKHRVAKGYRIPELDERLRRTRTRREAKILENARRAHLPVPRVHGIDIKEKSIEMDFVEGRLLKDIIPSADDREVADISRKVGMILSRLHEADIIHNDLTTSNMIAREGEVFLIDFGLSVTSTRIEDKAMDLVVFKKALNATHADRFDLIWSSLIEAYSGYDKSKQVRDRMAKIDKRGRYTQDR